MKRTSFQTMNCSVAQTLEVVGEWWTMLIIRDSLLGVTRFDDFQARLGISRNVLADRLDHLVDHGVLERRVYQEHPLRHDYVLTAKGTDLWLGVSAMRQWGDRWAAPEGPPTVLRHRECEHLVDVIGACEHCGVEVQRDATRVEPGPGMASARATVPIPANYD